MMVLDKIFAILPLFFILIAATVSLLSFRDNFPVNLKRLSVLWVFIFLVEITGHITGMMKIRNIWLYNIFNIIFLAGLIFILKNQLRDIQVKKIATALLVSFLLFSVFNISWLQKNWNYNTLNYVIGGTIIVLLSVLYFIELYRSDKTEKIYHDPFFWFCTGFLIYFGGTVPFFGMFNLMLENNFRFTSFYQKYVYVSFSVLLNILIAAGFLCRKNYPKTY
jgi:hypothetical protein